MSEKKINGRIVHKNDVEANWLLATTFVPKQGELIIYNADETHDYQRLKIGDGVTNVNSLPFVDDVLSSEINAISELVGDTAVATQISNAVSTKADISAGMYAVTTSGDGAAYTATVPGIDSLTVGTSFVMIPHTVSTSTSPTLDVNGLGAKSIKRRLSNLASSLQSGYAANWLTASKPFILVYDGTYWVVDGMTKPAAADLYGTAPKAKADADGNVITDTYATIAELQNYIPKLTSITLVAANWVGNSSLYSQDITLSCATATSMVTLQPTPDQLAAWQDDGLAFTTYSADGSVSVYVTGGLPTEDYTVQVLVQEVMGV